MDVLERGNCERPNSKSRLLADYLQEKLQMKPLWLG